MSQYLLSLQRAIAQTDTVREHPSEEHKYGWEEAAGDLEYGISCGSEHVVKSQMAPWLMGKDSPYFEELDSESDKGYCDRVKAIQLLMEKCDD